MQRVQLNEVSPEGYKAVYALEMHVRSRVDHELLDLVKLRASILNECAFCVDMHSTDGMAQGIDSRRLFAVAAWRESTFFDDRERAALALTDAITRIADAGVPDDVWNAAVEHFGIEGATDLVFAAGTINLWNRLAITAHAAPPALVG